MITEKNGNLLLADDVDMVVHQANLFHTFGAGIAAQIRVQYPEAYAADCATPNGHKSKLGTFSLAKVKRNKSPQIKYIANLYSQSGLGGKDRQTSYDAMVEGLTALRDTMEKDYPDYVLGMPHLIGCGLANGNWTIVRAIIESVFANSSINVVIYKFQP